MPRRREFLRHSAVLGGSFLSLFDLAGVRANFDKLAACYRKAGMPEKLRTRLYDRPHEFNARRGSLVGLGRCRLADRDRCGCKPE